jgi:hypothetical protein
MIISINITAEVALAAVEMGFGAFLPAKTIKSSPILSF